jgi:hypothetical protein
MISDVFDDPELLRWYLLGKLNETESDVVERRLLMDDELFELAQAVEDDLLAAGARGELAPEDRQAISRRLAASPRGQARLAVAEGLNALANGATATKAMRQAVVVPFLRQSRRQTPTFRAAAMAAGLFLALAGGAWLALQTAHPGEAVVTRNHATAAVRQAVRGTSGTPVIPRAPGASGTPTPPAGTKPAAPAPEQEHVAARPADPAPHRPTTPVTTPATAPLVFQLSLSVIRSAQDHPALTIPAGTQRVEIQLPLSEGEPFTTYKATILDAASEAEIWQGNLTPRSAGTESMVVVSLPAAKLPQGSYRMELRGLGGDGGEPELVGSPVFEVRTP